MIASLSVTHHHMRGDPASARRLRARVDRAREALVLDNIHLVPQTIRGFHRNRIPFADLVQDGRVGLPHAVVDLPAV